MSDIYKSPEAELHNPVSAGEYGSIETALEGRYHFQIGELLSEGWSTLKGMKTKFWVAAIMVMVVSGVLGFGFSLVTKLAAAGGSGGITTITFLVQQIVTILITAPMGAGIFMLALKHSIDAPTSFSEVFNYFSKAGKLLLLYVILYIAVAIGFLLLILPGIYLMIAYMMAIPLMVEKNIGAWAALETSRKAITKKWFKFLGLFLLFIFIAMAAAIPLGIGLIWVMPWFVLCYAILYRNMFGIEATTANS